MLKMLNRAKSAGLASGKLMLGLAVGLFVFAAFADDGFAYDVAAYVWPAYHNEPRWKELGLFADGKGEWQNLYEAEKRFPDDHWGVKPLWGYEDESDPVVAARKIDAATAAGVNVFIFDWYWYGGRPFLESALNDGFLKAANCKRMKFFLMYANHNVDRLWDNRIGSDRKKEVVWPAKITDEDWRTIVNRWISRYFKQTNYYRIKGCPVLSLFEPGGFIAWDGLDKAKERIAYLREQVKAAGFPNVHLQILAHQKRCYELEADSYTLYNWLYRTRAYSKGANALTYRKWGEQALSFLDGLKANAENRGKVHFPTLSVGWDINARYPKDDSYDIVHGANPQDFERFARQVKDWADDNIPAGFPKLITVNSWNEWTEGTYLEPDDLFGYGYLDALRTVFVTETQSKTAKKENGKP